MTGHIDFMYCLLTEGFRQVFKSFYFFIGITTYLDMFICYHASMMSYFQVFPMFTAKPISLHTFNNTSAFLSIVLISSAIEVKLATLQKKRPNTAMSQYDKLKTRRQAH